MAEKQTIEAQQNKIATRLDSVRHKILVLSGKGGVGKSSMTVNIAIALMQRGCRVGILDVDIHGPSVPVMMGIASPDLQTEGNEIVPPEICGIRVMSIGLMLQSPSDPVIWRGPMKMKVIQQLLSDVRWGDLDYLIIDSPPGTGDEPLSVCQLIKNMDGGVVVTTPQLISIADVRRSVSFCRKINLPVLGIVENMSGFVCSGCGKVTNIFRSGGGRSLCDEMDVPFLGKVPIDPLIAEYSDNGEASAALQGDGITAKALQKIVAQIDNVVQHRRGETDDRK